MPIFAVLALLTGCLPIPHTTPRSDDFHGRVLDAVTHAPVQSAKVALSISPYHATYTDAEGHFHMKATRNFHWLYLAGGGEWPNNKDLSMEITHSNYLTLEGGWSGDAGDILLHPKQSNTR